jgi:hypothetical protein
MAYRSTNKTVYSAKYQLISCPSGAPLEVVRRSVDNKKRAA